MPNYGISGSQQPRAPQPINWQPDLQQPQAPQPGTQSQRVPRPPTWRPQHPSQRAIDRRELRREAAQARGQQPLPSLRSTINQANRAINQANTAMDEARRVITAARQFSQHVPQPPQMQQPRADDQGGRNNSQQPGTSASDSGEFRPAQPRS